MLSCSHIVWALFIVDVYHMLSSCQDVWVWFVFDVYHSLSCRHQHFKWPSCYNTTMQIALAFSNYTKTVRLRWSVLFSLYSTLYLCPVSRLSGHSTVILCTVSWLISHCLRTVSWPGGHSTVTMCTVSRLTVHPMDSQLVTVPHQPLHVTHLSSVRHMIARQWVTGCTACYWCFVNFY